MLVVRAELRKIVSEYGLKTETCFHEEGIGCNRKSTSYGEVALDFAQIVQQVRESGGC